MFKKLLLFLLSILSVNCAEQFPINQSPYVVFSDKGTNDYMQDRSCVVVKDDHAFFGVFDGHGSAVYGHEISEFLSKNLYKNILEYGIINGFKQTDKQMADELLETFVKTQGSTASVAVIKDNKIYIGHVGDSKIVLVRNKKVIELTHDHNTKPDKNNPEYKRIQKLASDKNINLEEVILSQNGKWFLSNGEKMISMTRAFGDKEFFPYIISIPEANDRDITDEDEFLVLATDGLWDTIIRPDKSQTREIQLNYVGAFLRSKDNWRDGAKALFDYAMERWATSENGSDNIEIVVVNLNELYKKLFNAEQELEKQLSDLTIEEQKKENELNYK